MGKLSVLHTVLVVSALGVVALPPTESFAKNWFERVFSPQKSQQQRKRAPRAAKRQTTPVVAPIPEMRPDNEPPVTAEDSAAALAYASPDGSATSAPIAEPETPVADVPPNTPAPPVVAVPSVPPVAAPEEVTAAPADAAPPPTEAPAQAKVETLVPAPPQAAGQGTIDLRTSVPNASEIVPETPAGTIIAPIAAPESDAQALKPAPVQGPPLPAPGELEPEETVAKRGMPDGALPSAIPIPEPDPRVAALIRPDETQPEKPEPPQKAALPMLPDPRATMRPDPSGKLPAEEVACRARLDGLGVKFETSKAQADEAVGCTLPYPIVVSSLGGGIEVSPNAEMNCAMAEAAARFMQDVVSPAAKAELGTTLKGISQASSYVCRPRHGTRKLSEHAFGNALDLAAFEMADKSSVEVEMTPPTDKEKRFLDAIRKAACGPFKTVLGPGSDADHALHFHLDLEPRRRGTFCQ